MSRSSLSLGQSWRIPLEDGHAVSRGWTEATDFQPSSVTWHWTATRTLKRCNQLLGGANPERKGQASAHVAIGRSWQEGVEQYVSLDDRSWHAGKHQSLRFDGQPYQQPSDKGARCAIGIETVNVGFARPGFKPDADWIEAYTVDGRRLLVEPWAEEQIEMMIWVGRWVLDRWPHLPPRSHHGHHDLCPGYKDDVVGFPFARVLRGIYSGTPYAFAIPDVWSASGSNRQRRAILRRCGYHAWGATDDDIWRRSDDLALRRFQADQGLADDGSWTTAVAWRAFDLSGIVVVD